MPQEKKKKDRLNARRRKLRPLKKGNHEIPLPSKNTQQDPESNSLATVKSTLCENTTGNLLSAIELNVMYCEKVICLVKRKLSTNKIRTLAEQCLSQK